MNTEMVMIKKSEYDELLRSDFFLQCLRMQGVDNWMGYDDAVENFNAEFEDEH